MVIMAAEWFTEWSEKRGECVTPGESFSEGTEFQDRLDQSLEEFYPDTSVNREGVHVSPTLTEPDMIGRISSGNREGYYYARAGHPVFSALERVVAAMEAGGTRHPEHFSSLVFSSGMAAISAVLETLARESGERSGVVLHGRVMYSHTTALLADPERKNRSWLGPFVGKEDTYAYANNLITEETVGQLERSQVPIIGLIYEPIANPTIEYTHTPSVVKLAQRHGIPVIVDNTFLTPYLNEPLRAGADIVIHSMTKYMSGEGDLMGGCVTGPTEFMNALKETRTIRGSVMGLHDAREFIDRLSGLPERVEQHVANAREIANCLDHISGIRTCYSTRAFDVAGGSAGGVVSFVFEGTDAEAAERSLRLSRYLCDNPGVVRQATSLGEQQTLVLPFAGQLGGYKKLVEGHIPAGLVRIAAGREHPVRTQEVSGYLTAAINACL
ncbi:PLP-dependent transferase [Candidatus Woesearchaeota archaeon]|nr:PLP-dependent transferase [Candidatus Woesearchaeota archaeon]